MGSKKSKILSTYVRKIMQVSIVPIYQAPFIEDRWLLFRLCVDISISFYCVKADTNKSVVFMAIISIIFKRYLGSRVREPCIATTFRQYDLKKNCTQLLLSDSQITLYQGLLLLYTNYEAQVSQFFFLVGSDILPRSINQCPNPL